MVDENLSFKLAFKSFIDSDSVSKHFFICTLDFLVFLILSVIDQVCNIS